MNFLLQIASRGLSASLFRYSATEGLFVLASGAIAKGHAQWGGRIYLIGRHLAIDQYQGTKTRGWRLGAPFVAISRY